MGLKWTFICSKFSLYPSRCNMSGLESMQNMSKFHNSWICSSLKCHAVPILNGTKCEDVYDYNNDGITYDYKYWINGVSLMVVAIFGIIGTIMSIIVLLQTQFRNFFSKLLIALCAFDCTFLIMSILHIALPSISCL